MNTPGTNEIVADYMKRLGDEARALPPAEREELLGSISEHIADALPHGAGEAETRTVLERLGEPEELVADAAGEGAVPGQPEPKRRLGRAEWAALILLALGGIIIPVLGWLAGLVFLWASEAWTVREKLIGTFVVPGGLATVFWGALLLGATGAQVCTGVNGAVVHCAGGRSGGANLLLGLVLVALAVAEIWSVLFLARRAAPGRGHAAAHARPAVSA